MKDIGRCKRVEKVRLCAAHVKTGDDHEAYFLRPPNVGLKQHRDRLTVLNYCSERRFLPSDNWRVTIEGKSFQAPCWAHFLPQVSPTRTRGHTKLDLFGS